jgi:hypothetical protein
MVNETLTGTPRPIPIIVQRIANGFGRSPGVYATLI